MPEIPYTAERFNAFPPTGKLLPGQVGVTASGSKTVSFAEVCAYAASVGDIGILGMQPPRPANELLWRRLMVRSSLTTHMGHFAKSSSYKRLDPSEKSAVSYFLGMAQCAAMADKVLGVRATVHVDSLIKLLGRRLPRRSRPDLIGFAAPPTSLNSPGRFLLEAKGRTHQFSVSTVESALEQLSNPPAVVQNLVGVNSVHAASLAYFEPLVRRGTPVWRSHLEDPPPDDQSPVSELSDSEFCGVVLIAQLLPIQRAIADIRAAGDGEQIEEQDGLTGAELPGTGAHIAIPTKLYTLLERIDGPLSDPAAREALASQVWEATRRDYSPDALLAAVEGEGEIATLGSGISYAELSVEQRTENRRS